jgi:hypothetical protein
MSLSFLRIQPSHADDVAGFARLQESHHRDFTEKSSVTFSVSWLTKIPRAVRVLHGTRQWQKPL